MDNENAKSKTNQNNRSNKMDVAQEHKRRKFQSENNVELAQEVFDGVTFGGLKTKELVRKGEELLVEQQKNEKR
ncbi:hypothetical protein KHQ82_08710 [Mycoplasmatota bacterium]|nr:hypothetical protein KHQ82_08710 [Mycoplasmatota bacterium]